MLNWRSVLDDVGRAIALPPAHRDAFLGTLDTEDTYTDQVRTLLKRAEAGFLATSMPDEMLSETQLVGTPGQWIGPWRLETLLGRGGMGEVWRAQRADGLYEQTAAVKLMQPGGVERARRFEEERRRLARMEHPGIARILDGGVTPGGAAFMAMDFVNGQPVDAYAAGRPLSEKVRLMADICDAVHHAHTKLVLHRDIKPANVLVDRTGQVRLIDFGIASAIDSNDGGGPLTLAYAAPEQLRGEALSVAADVFALAVLLSQLVTGAIPQRKDDASLIVPPDGLSKDMHAIITRASHQQLDGRFSTAAAMAEDLRASLGNRPVAARGNSRAYRITTFLRRYPAGSAASAVAVLALVGGLSASLMFAADTQAEAARTREALMEAEYQYEMAQANLLGQNTYGDILYELYAEEGRGDELTAALLQRWAVLHADSDKNPDQASSSSFVLGRQFHLRRDHTNAQTVLGAWLAEGYGPRSLRAMGQEFYAMSLFESGKHAEALPEMYEVMASFETGHRRPLQDQLNFALRLATLTNAPADIEKAETLYHAVAAGQAGQELTATQQLTSLQSLMHILRLKGDHDGKIRAAEEIMSVYEANPDHVLGRGLARANLGMFYLYHQDRAAAAEAAARKIVGYDQAAEGESAVTAKGYYLLARSLMHQGQSDPAREALAQGRILQEKYTGLAGGGPDFDLVEAELAGLRLDLGAAEAALARADGHAHPAEYALAKAHVSLIAGGDRQAILDALTVVLKPVRPLHGKREYLLRRLQELGPPEATDPVLSAITK